MWISLIRVNKGHKRDPGERVWGDWGDAARRMASDSCSKLNSKHVVLFLNISLCSAVTESIWFWVLFQVETPLSDTFSSQVVRNRHYFVTSHPDVRGTLQRLCVMGKAFQRQSLSNVLKMKLWCSGTKTTWLSFRKHPWWLVSHGRTLVRDPPPNPDLPPSWDFHVLSCCAVALIVSYLCEWIYIGASLKPAASHIEAKGYLLWGTWQNGDIWWPGTEDRAVLSNHFRAISELYSITAVTMILVLLSYFF